MLTRLTMLAARLQPISPRNLAVGAFLAVLIVQVAVGIVLPLPSIDEIITRNLMDEGYYARYAINLVEHGEFREGSLRAYFPPGYPLLIAVMIGSTESSAIALQCIQNAMFAGAAAGLCYLAAALGGGLSGALTALLLLSNPGWLLRPQQVMSETLFLVLLVAALMLVHRWRHDGGLGRVVLAGVLLGATSLVREIGLFHVIAVGIAMIAFTSDRRGVLSAVILGLTAAAVVLPWTARNNAVFGRPIPVTTNGPINLYLGNNPGYTLRNTAWRIPERVYPFWNKPGGTPADELRVIDAAMEDARAYILQDLSGFIRRGFGKSWGMWGPVPIGEGSMVDRAVRVGKNLWWVFVAPLALWGFVSFRREPIVLSVFLALLAAAAIHFVTVGNVNYRLPWEALLTVPAALVLAPLLVRRDHAKSSVE